MKKVFFLLITLLTLFFVTYIAARLYSAQSNKIYILNVEGVINPVISGYILKGISEAELNNADAVLIKLDTPGGMLESTRSIIQRMLNSKIPVIVYVYPNGSRAASAGVFLMMASDVAAMAPLTHMGAAHPVSIGGRGLPLPGESERPENGKDEKDKKSGQSVMDEKILSDTVAYIENLSKEKGRNYEWAVKAVRESVSVTARDALELKVIEYVAEDTNELLSMLEGKEIVKNNVTFTLEFENAVRVEYVLSSIKKFLHAIANPNIAYMLLIIGFYGLIYEFSSPGIGLGAVAGSISLVLAFYSLQMLPVNYVGLTLLVLGLIMLILETQIASSGLLTIGGIISFVLGSFFLIDASEHYMRISVWVIAGTATGTLLVVGYALKKVLQIHRIRPTTGKEGLIGKEGVVKEKIDLEGMVFVNGELWSALSDEVCEAGSRVQVVEVKNNKLVVRKLNN